MSEWSPTRRARRTGGGAEVRRRAGGAALPRHRTERREPAPAERGGRGPVAHDATTGDAGVAVEVDPELEREELARREWLAGRETGEAGARPPHEPLGEGKPGPRSRHVLPERSDEMGRGRTRIGRASCRERGYSAGCG